MPYQKRDDGPDSVQDHLPVPVQDIYRAACNGAWVRHDHREARMRRVTWAAGEQQCYTGESSGHRIRGVSGGWAESRTH